MLTGIRDDTNDSRDIRMDQDLFFKCSVWHAVIILLFGFSARQRHITESAEMWFPRLLVLAIDKAFFERFPPTISSAAVVKSTHSTIRIFGGI